jgi:hypothetical protein
MSPTPARIRSTIAAAVDQPDDLRELRRFHKVLADVNRLRICRVLAEGPATVTEPSTPDTQDDGATGPGGTGGLTGGADYR